MNAMTPFNSVGTVAGALASRALIVSLTISKWEPFKKDKGVTEEIQNAKNAKSDSGNFNKRLIPKEALAGIDKIVNETRAEFNRRTLPWKDNGGRIVASHEYFELGKYVRGQVGRIDEEVEKLIENFPAYMAQARPMLGDMFDPADYPSPDEVRKKFTMEIDVRPVENGSDLRVNLSQAQANMIRADIEESISKAAEKAQRDIYERVRKVAERMVDRLTTYKPATKKGEKTEGVFTYTLTENVQELIDVLPSFNIVGDPKFDELIDKLRPLVQYDVKTLREDEGKRADIAHEAQKILDHISDYL